MAPPISECKGYAAFSRFLGIPLIPYSSFRCRIPLIKGKTARKALKEQGLWEEFRKRYPYNPMVKFIQSDAESMTNDADVSPDQKQLKLGDSHCVLINLW